MVAVAVGIAVTVVLLCGFADVSQVPRVTHPSTPMAQQAEKQAPDHDHATTDGLAVHHDAVAGAVVRTPALQHGAALAWPALAAMSVVTRAIAAAHGARAPPCPACSPWGRGLLLTVCVDRC